MLAYYRVKVLITMRLAPADRGVLLEPADATSRAELFAVRAEGVILGAGSRQRSMRKALHLAVARRGMGSP
jgi:hypothetical protein